MLKNNFKIEINMLKFDSIIIVLFYFILNIYVNIYKKIIIILIS